MLFNSPSEQFIPPRNKMWFTFSWPRSGFHHSVTVRMPTRSMAHETASFYWHGIQSVRWVYVLGFAVGATYYSSACTCPHLTTQSALMPPPPPLPSLHKCNQPCQGRQNRSLSPSIVSDWLCRGTIAPSSLPSPYLWIPLQLAWSQGILPHPSYSHPLTSLGAHPPIHQPPSPLVGWQSPSATEWSRGTN